jgi:hypothetical protein
MDLSRRILGGFYVLHPLGSGGVSSVFVVSRAEERHRDDATRFALKVPDYSAEAARTLSEEEFLNLFRQEAGALLALPQHANLARFVTFDAGARPKPILVMELVEGPTLERVIERGDLDVNRAGWSRVSPMACSRCTGSASLIWTSSPRTSSCALRA